MEGSYFIFCREAAKEKELVKTRWPTVKITIIICEEKMVAGKKKKKENKKEVVLLFASV